MKWKFAVFMVVLMVASVICLPTTSQALVNIPNQAAFDVLFALANNDLLFTAAQSPYCLGVGAPDPLTLVVAANHRLRLEPGASILLDVDVSLEVRGKMIQTGVDGQMGPVTFGRYDEELPWGSIILSGDLNYNDLFGNGRITLLNSIIEGGGSENGFDEVYHGLLVVIGNSSELTIGEAVEQHENLLRSSISNGISIMPADGEMECIVHFYDTFMDDPQNPITFNGIKFAHEEEFIGNESTPELLVERSSIKHCGLHGIVVYQGWNGDYTVRNSSIDENGTEGEGCGFYFHHVMGQYGQFFNVLIESSSIQSNQGDGIRFEECAGRLILRDSEVSYNNTRGLYFDFEGPNCYCLYIERNVFSGNGWEGVFLQKNGASGGAKIRGNEFTSNGADTDDPQFGEDAGDLPKCANIRFRGSIGTAGIGLDVEDDDLETDIKNNIIAYGLTGISLEPLEGFDAAPEQVHIENNIQYGAQYQGLRIADLWARDALPDPLPTVYNNVFHGNGSAEDDGHGNGIYIMATCPDFGESNFIQNNILSGNSDVGIEYEPEDNPDFSTNGFKGNTTNRIGCTSQDGIDAGVNDPVFVDAVNHDFHLLWNSAMINRGNSDGVFNDASFRSDPEDLMTIPRDGSPNDMGAYGGRGAGDYGFEPYCAIPSAAQVCNDNLPANRDWLEWDYYRVFGSITTPSDELIDIGEPQTEDGRAYFEFAGNYSWTVYGTFHANGQDGTDGIGGFGENRQAEALNIYFHPIPGATAWDRIRPYLLDGDSWFLGCDLVGSGIYAYGGTTVNPDLMVSNCRISDADSYGLCVSGDVPTTCQYSEVTGSHEDGVYISQNEGLSTVKGCTLTENGIYSSDGGLLLHSSTSVVAGNMIGLNYSHGITLQNCSPSINGGIDDPNVIYNNGVTLAQSNGTGAEFYLNYSEPDLALTNIWDIDGVAPDAGNRRAKFVYKANSGDIPFPPDCYWGGNDSWPNIGIVAYDNLSGAERAALFTRVGVPGVDDNEDAFIVGGAEPPPTSDNVTDLEMAHSLMREGQYAEAIPYFQAHLEDNEKQFQMNALQNLFTCYRRTNGSMTTLRSGYLAYAENESASEANAFEARRLACRATLYDNQPSESADQLQELLCDAGSAQDSIRIEMDVAWADLIASETGAGTDALTSYDDQMKELWSRLDEAGEIEEKETSFVPAEFVLESAYPNPFNSTTRINYSLPQAAKISLQVIDLQGRLVATLIQGIAPAGSHSVVWNAGTASAGVYFCRLNFDGGTKATQLLLLK